MHWQYLCYVARHKLYVFRSGLKLGIPIWSLFWHDWTKFLPIEWTPYVRSFYGPKYPKLADMLGDEHNRAIASGHYKEKIREDFDIAWNHHQKVNRHHWQYWFLVLDDGGQKILPMPDNDRREMLADWIGAGLAMGKTDTKAWYLKNFTNIQLHHETRLWVERQLGDG